MEAVAPVRSEELGLPVDGGDQWEDEPEGLAWGVDGMDFVDNEGLQEAEGGELATEMDNEESDEEAIAEEVPPIEVDIEGVPEYADVPWDETVIPDGVGVEEIDWSPWYAKCPKYGEVWRVVCVGSRWVQSYTLYTPQGNRHEKRRLHFDHR